jgi:hypothetical protein
MGVVLEVSFVIVIVIRQLYMIVPGFIYFFLGGVRIDISSFILILKICIPIQSLFFAEMQQIGTYSHITDEWNC